MLEIRNPPNGTNGPVKMGREAWKKHDLKLNRTRTERGDSVRLSPVEGRTSNQDTQRNGLNHYTFPPFPHNSVRVNRSLKKITDFVSQSTSLCFVVQNEKLPDYKAGGYSATTKSSLYCTCLIHIYQGNYSTRTNLMEAPPVYTRMPMFTPFRLKHTRLKEIPALEALKGVERISYKGVTFRRVEPTKRTSNGITRKNEIGNSHELRILSSSVPRAR